MARIVLQTPDGNLFESELTPPRMSIGRSEDNDLCIPDGSVSGSHGEFTQDGHGWRFSDLGSTNGTKVSGQRVDNLELGNGAKFEIGNVLCSFYDEEAAVEDHSAPAYAAPRTVTTSSGGYGSTPIERSARVGFGPKKAKADGARSGLMFFGVIALLAALGVAAMIFNGGLK